MNGESKRWELLEEKYNGVVVSAFCGASTRLPASDFLSPISWLLVPWLLGSLAPLPAGG
jgi:hypothetical protein